MKNFLAFGAGVTLGLLVAAAASCSGTPACTHGNCTGCCDSKGVCQSGSAQNNCGNLGSSCVACTTNEICSASVCTPLTGTGGGSGTGGGGSNCKNTGAQCLSAGECCSTSCVNGTCAAG